MADFMISRVAESCFWLQRYVERSDSMARLLKTNHDFVLDVGVAERWNPVIVVSGEQERFPELVSEAAVNDDAAVQNYLVWEERNPVSLASSAYWARENARMIREVISNEMWMSINTFWHWLNGEAGHEMYKADRPHFYEHHIEFAATFLGLAAGTMMHGAPFDFMRLGGYLERAAQTARIMDVKHHMLGPTQPGAFESPVESAQWMNLLRSCSATEPFFKASRGAPSGPRVAGFLLFEADFPRSILHCLREALVVLDRIRRTVPASVGQRSSRSLEPLVHRLETRSLEEVFHLGIHEELTAIIDAISDVCGDLNSDYFNPRIDSLPPPPAG